MDKMIKKEKKIKTDIISIMFTICFSCYFISAYYEFQIVNIEFYTLLILLAFLIIMNQSLKTDSMDFQWIKNIILSILPAMIISIIRFFIADVSIEYAYKFYIYLLLPPIVVFLLVNNKNFDINYFFNIILTLAVIFFFVKFRNKFNLEEIKKIDFRTSYSPFETGNEFLTFTFFACEVFFGETQKKGRCFLAYALCAISFKRYLMAIGTIYLIFCLISRWGKTKLKIFKNKHITFFIIFLVSLGYIVSTIVQTNAVEQNQLNDFFKMYDKISSSRMDLMKFVLRSKQENFGLGTSSYIIAFGARKQYSAAAGVHNELFRLLYETGIVGLSCFIFFQFWNSRHNIKLFIFLIAFLMHLTVSNFLSDFYPMMIYYLLNYYFYRNANNDSLTKKCKNEGFIR